MADAAFVGNLQSLGLDGNYAGTLEVARNLTVNQVSTCITPLNPTLAIAVDAGDTLTALAMALSGGMVAGAGTLSIVGAPNAPAA